MQIFINKLKKPINIDVNPVFSWILEKSMQEAYKVDGFFKWKNSMG